MPTLSRESIRFAATISIFAAAALASTPALAADPLDVTFRVAVHVANDDDGPVQNDTWIAAEFAEAERLFGPIGVHFVRESAAYLPAKALHLETRADRDALASELDKGRIHVMLVGTLRDVDTPPLYRRGVHWRPQASPSKHYVILASSAGVSTLAHELGHFFGNPHVATPNNLMSYIRTSDDVFLDEPQKKKIVAFAGIYLRSKELLPVKE